MMLDSPDSNASSRTAKTPRQRRRRRLPFTHLLVYLAIAAAVVATALVLRPKPPAVETALTTRGELVVELEEEGETRVRDRFVVSAPISGVVSRIDLDPGDPVVRGETILAVIEPPGPSLLDARSRAELQAAASAAEATVGLARAERDQAQAELAFALAERDRYRRLAEAEVVSTERLETAELTARTRQEARQAADFAVHRAERELTAARARLSTTSSPHGAAVKVSAPTDGVLLRRLRESEATVSAGEPLVEIADIANLEIVADFLSTDAVQMSPGAPVTIERWGGGDDLHGVVQRIEPAAFTKISALGVEEQRVNVIIDFSDPQTAWGVLGDGYRVEVAVTIWSSDDVLRIPLPALFRDGDDWAAFVVENGRALIRRLQLGVRGELEAEVLEGLEPGVPVILYPDEAIADGARVRLTADTEP